MARRSAWLAPMLLVLAAVVAVVVVVVGDATPSATGAAAPTNQGRFIVECRHSHSASDDPIVWPGRPGRSHHHDFFGNTEADADATLTDLEAGSTTCIEKEDLASYWAPALYDGDRHVVPSSSDSYYRAAPGVRAADLVAFPPGFKVIAGDPTATAAQPLDVVGWGCGRNPRLRAEPPSCGPGSPLTLHVVFPDCWDGVHVDSDDHRSHTAYSVDGECPPGQPRHVPQLEFIVQYPFSGDPSGLRLASGDVHTGHADFFNAWVPERLEREIRGCLGRDVVCGVPSI